MLTVVKPQSGVSPTEVLILAVLREQGPQTLESLCAVPEVSSSQALLAVDRLSRSGAVSIKPIARCEYRVALISTDL